MDTVVAALAALGQAAGINQSSMLYAAVSATHIAAIALLFGPILLVDLRLLGLAAGLNDPAMLVLRRTAALGAVIAVLSGILLLAARPAEYAANQPMLIKLGVVACGLINALLFEWATWRGWSAVKPGHPYARVAVLLSLAAWPAALALGRWVAFV